MSAEGLFPPTMWTRVIHARDGEDTAARQSMDALARAYWRPLYVFLRQRGQGHDDAAESVQGFFNHLLSRNFLDFVRPREGKFRTFLLSSLTRWLNDRHDQAAALKRGGGEAPVSLEELDAAGKEIAQEPGESPEMRFDRQWALLVFDRGLASLRAECAARDRLPLFELLASELRGEGNVETYASLAARTGSTEGAVKKAAFDLRGRLGELLRAEIRETVRDGTDIEEEIRYLITLLRTP
jgi:DNA-directed RNA polymerase specialized sigma24 family protein